MSTTMSRAERWKELAAIDNLDARAQAMAREFTDMAKLPEAQREAEVREAATVTYSLDDAGLRRMTEARLRAWLLMDEADAHAIGEAYEKASNEMPGDQAMRRVMIVQAVAHELTLEEQAKIRAIIPAALGDAPAALPSSSPAMAADSADHRQKPWWKFWGAA